MIPAIRKFNPQIQTVKTDYGEISNKEIVKIFGHDMKYYQLRKRGNHPNETAYLTTKVETHKELLLFYFTAYLDKEVLYEDELT